jgi:hypothetical protein
VPLHHDRGRTPPASAAALEESAGGGAVRDAVLWRIAEAAADVGLAGADAAGIVREARRAGIL